MYISQCGLSQRIFGMAEKHNLTLEKQFIRKKTNQIVISTSDVIEYHENQL